MKRLILCALALTIALSLAAKSKGFEMLKSLAVPGLSQVTNGRAYGYAMMASEVGIISSMMYFNNEEKLKAREAYEFALKFAHINMGKYSDQYFRTLSRYDSSGFEAGGYNYEVLETARQIYPHDPEAQQQYVDANAIPDDQAWNWDSTETRGKYSKIRIKSQDMRDYGSIAVGVLILNHLVSGVDVLRFFTESARSQVYIDYDGDKALLMLNIHW
jgi:hypothetical protein